MAKNILEPPKEKGGFFDSNQKNLNYKDSWLQNTVELAALGTILTGAGTLAVKGNLKSNMPARALGAMGKGFENYLKRNGHLGTKFGYQVGKKTFGNLRRMPKNQENGAQLIQDIIDKGIKEVDDDKVMKAKIRKEVARRLSIEEKENVVDKAIDGSAKFPKGNEVDRARYLYEKVRGEEINKKLHPEQYESKRRPRNSGPQAAPFDKKQLSRDMVGAGLTGLAFGAGISGFHAIDRLSGNPDTQKKLEDSFDYAGSFLTKEDDKKMDKRAGALEFYNGLGAVGRKTPEAIASGLGFTGVSLATAKAMNGQDPRAGKKSDENKSTRVIIELGGEEEDQHNSLPMGLKSLPKLSSSPTSGLAKLAAPSFRGLKQFGRDLRGYDKQIKELDQVNPADVAAVRLKNQDVNSMVKDRYGNLADTEYMQGQFTNRLFDSEAASVKNELNLTKEDLQNRTAKARLTAGGGVLAAGGLAGLAAIPKNREESP